MKLRTKFGIVLLCVTVLLSGAVYGGLEFYEGQTREQTQRNVDETTHLAAQQISSSVTERMDYIGLVASRPEAARFERSDAYLDGILDSTRFFAAQVVDANGTVLTFRGAIDESVRQETVGENVSDEAYFREAVVRGIYVSDPQYVEDVGEHIVVVSAPIFEDGELAGVLAASIYVTEETFFESIVPVDTASRSVTVQGGNATLYESEESFEPGTRASATVEPVGWTLTVTRDGSVLNEQLRDLAIAQGLGLLVVLLSVVSFGIWEYRENLQQTRRLLDGFAELQAGNYDAELDLSDSEEWTEIGDGFDELSAGLASREAEIRDRGQRLEVLNRVLRHNLRNDMSVVVNSAELVTRFADDEQAKSAAENVAVIGRRLVDTGEKARRLEQLLRDPTVRETDLVPVVEAAVSDVRSAHPDASIVTHGPETALVEAVSGVDFAVENLVENAVVHNDRADPSIELHVTRVEASEPAVTLTVSDDGPGIPQQERDVLDEGTESPLQHGSGLGLWATQWVVEKSDGEMSFDVDDEGTSVTLSFPASVPSTEQSDTHEDD